MPSTSPIASNATATVEGLASESEAVGGDAKGAVWACGPPFLPNNLTRWWVVWVAQGEP